MDTVHCHILTRDPLVIVGYGGPLGPAGALAKHLDRRPAWFLVSPWWSIEDPGVYAEILDAYPTFRREHPQAEIVYLCNTAREVELLAARGIPAVFCHQNAFVDERLFTPDPGAARRLRAVYNARLSPFKRHELAQDVAGLGLIYYCLGETERRMYSLLRRLMPEALFLNGPPEPGRHRFFSPAKTSAYYNAAACGLCLSACEGAMYVSVEYQLAGLPVVSTPNAGGRDYFLAAPYAVTAAPEPVAVAEAVAYLADLAPDPLEVRRAVLARMLPERERLIALVQAILDASGKSIDFKAIWPEVFINKLHVPNRAAADVAAACLSPPHSPGRDLPGAREVVAQAGLH